MDSFGTLHVIPVESVKEKINTIREGILKG